MIAQALLKVLRQDRDALETRVQPVGGEEAPRGKCQEPMVYVENPGPQYSPAAQLSNLPGVALGLRVKPTNKVQLAPPLRRLGARGRGRLRRMVFISGRRCRIRSTVRFNSATAAADPRRAMSTVPTCRTRVSTPVGKYSRVARTSSDIAPP
ncbi:hypothetical protein HPB48_010741 [Haemaphysalis longicornis]|uniref:Uncharacterized protein n=1 Tax=Haemaphysalis longicornis TaxID=44386 RepID=A0A9J6GAF9_HAELO|nr:hypothetical protein HPB48_010741 [Haemaphysalis longicornis]